MPARASRVCHVQMAKLITFSFTVVPRGVASWLVAPNTHPSLILPFTMVAYCEPCGCSFPNSLAEHNMGKKHRRNIAASGTANPVTQQSPPPQSNHPNSRPMSLPSTSSPAISVPTSITSDPRVTVSHESGFDFEIEGTGIAGQSSFTPVDLAILIEKTDVVSTLSISDVKPIPVPGTPESWCGLFDDSMARFRFS